MKEVIRL